MKRLLSGRTLLNPAVRSVSTINLAGAVGRDGDLNLTNTYEVRVNETNDTKIRVLEKP